MNSDMVKLEKFGHLQLVYHYTVPLTPASTSFEDALTALSNHLEPKKNFTFEKDQYFIVPHNIKMKQLNICDKI